MSEKDFQYQIQVKILKIFNWVFFFVLLALFFILWKEDRMAQFRVSASLSAIIAVSLFFVYRGSFELASFISVFGLLLAVCTVSLMRINDPMGIYEFSSLSSVAVFLSCILARRRWFPLFMGIYCVFFCVILGFLIQPFVLTKINLSDTLTATFVAIMVTIISDRLFLMTGQVMHHFNTEVHTNKYQRQQMDAIAQESKSGQDKSNLLKEQTTLGETATTSLQESVQKITEKMHTLDTVIHDFVSRNEDVSHSAGNIMGVFNKHRDGMENYRNKIEHMSETSQEIDFITKNKQSQLNDLIQTTKDGEESVKKSVVAIEKVAENSKDMLNMISLIMEVAERTNVLALNAAVEASRAGKAGGGFAIVAKEIKNLSTETTQNADVINRSLRSNIKYIEEAVEIIRHSGEAFVGITTNLSDFSVAIDDIVNRVNALSEENVHMSTETRDILTLVDEVQQVLEKMIFSIEQTTGKVGHIQEASENLNSNFQNLKNQTNIMRTTTHKIQEIQTDLSFCSQRVVEIADSLSLSEQS